MAVMMHVAYFCEPHIGGMYSFFLKLRPELRKQDIDLRCVCPFPAALYRGTPEENEEGVDFLDLADAPSEATRQLIEHLESRGYSAAVVLPGCYEIASNLPRYLPRSIRCVARLPHNARGVYLPTQFIAPYLDRIVAVSDRLKADLVADYGIEADKIRILYNGISTEAQPPPHGRKPGEPLNLLFVGRLEDLQKNVFLLPPLLKRVVGDIPDARLTLVGSGPDREQLEKRFERLGLRSRVHLAGALPYAEMQRVWRDAHVFVLPSRFEGCPNALLEAMRAGCVPVVSRLRGITDVFVEDGVSGVLCPVGSVGSFADGITRLARDEDLRLRMASAAQARVERHFSLDRMVHGYASLFRELAETDSTRRPPLPLAAFEMPSEFGPTWRRYVPRSVKKRVRTWMERWGRSI